VREMLVWKICEEITTGESRSTDIKKTLRRFTFERFSYIQKNIELRFQEE
jgi:hypothetical protein